MYCISFNHLCTVRSEHKLDNNDRYLQSLLTQWKQGNCLDQRTDLTLEDRCNVNHSKTYYTCTLYITQIKSKI